MTTQADFTPEEWQTILTSPTVVGTTVMLAATSGPIGTVKEMIAVGKAVAEVIEKGSSNSLVQALAQDAKARIEAQKAKQPDQEVKLDPEVEQKIKGAKSAEAARAVLMQEVSEVAALVTSKASADEAQGFKQWLMDIAVQVAQAAKEGGFLGFGGTLVSDTEKAALNELSGVLGVPAPAA